MIIKKPKTKKSLFSRSHFLSSSKGFTVIESVVVASIIIIVLGTLFSAYPRFRDRTALSTLTRKVALVIRESQVFGLAVKEFPRDIETPLGIVDIVNFPDYGVHFSLDNPKQIILFADVGSLPGLYDTSLACGHPDSECIRRINISGTEFISDICVSNDVGGVGSNRGIQSRKCAAEGVREINITFRRPDPEAHILTGVSDGFERYNVAEIYLSSLRLPDATRIVRTWISGQISVD